MIIKGSLSLQNSNIESLGELEEVHGSLNLGSCKQLESLGKLEIVKGGLYIDDCILIKELPKHFDHNSLQLLFAIGSGITKRYLKENFTNLIKSDKVEL